MREVLAYRVGGGVINLNLVILNLVRQNALIRTEYISQCHIDSSATMS